MDLKKCLLLGVEEWILSCQFNIIAMYEDANDEGAQG